MGNWSTGRRVKKINCAVIAVAACIVLSGTIRASEAEPAGSSAEWRHYPQPPSAPKGAPNILIILTDDVGFGAASTFGGPIETPALDALAQNGLRYTKFHTTAMCSPTRAALLTGRNHHAVGSGVITELSTDDDGYTSVIPKSAATIGRVLTDHGYATAWFGKNHNTPRWEISRTGPFDRWPTGLGFQYFYGFNGADTNQFAPDLIENTDFIERPNDKDYILDKDLADHAVQWLRREHNLQPNTPFFIYYAPGAAHMPNQAAADWIQKFRGKFDMGWDKLREQTLQRQIAMGVAPKGTHLTKRPDQIPAWDSLSDSQKKVDARMMEVYAAQLAYCDDQISRILSTLHDLGELDNTLVFYIEGDNGGATEILDGARNFEATFAGINESADETLEHLNELGGPKSLELYPVGWAWAMNAPFQWGKQVASHFGGTRNGMVISWPHHIQTVGGFRTQFHHVIDIAPTVYEAAGITPPKIVDGVDQQPLDGVSMLYTLNAPSAPSRHREQYFEMLGNMAYYKDGWIASSTPRRMPWAASDGSKSEPHWELYDIDRDFSQSDDVAPSQPEKLRELQRDFEQAARENKVFPIDTMFLSRFSPALRPNKLAGRDNFTYYASNDRYPSADFPNLTKSWRLTIDLTAPEPPADGALIVHGDRFAGYGVVIERGRALFLYRASDRPVDLTTIRSANSLSPGHHVIDIRVQPNPGHSGMKATMSIDQTTVGSAVISHPLNASDASTYVGRSGPVPLEDSFDLPPKYNGRVEKVEVMLDHRSSAVRP
jgi:arylsulfatase